ncbi:MAG: flippase-like domain-containing protein [Anaerolineae bacterium]|nr:flippase-like domain-containing protein [Anaerolineae bacterium]
MAAETAQRKRNRTLSWFFNLLGIALFGLILYLGGADAWQQIVNGDWGYAAAALAVTIAWNLLAAFRWASISRWVLADAGPLPFRYYFTYHMIGMFMGQVVPITVGMLGARPVALSLSQEVSLRRSAVAVLLDKLFDLLLALLLVGPVALYLVGWLGLTTTLVLMVCAVILGAIVVGWQYERAISLASRLGSRAAHFLTRIPMGRRLVRRVPEQLERLSEEQVLPNRAALASFLITVGMYALLSARLYLISQAMRLGIPWAPLMMGISVTQLALIFSVTPGSLGFLEGGWAAVLSLAGVSHEQFLAFVIGRRVYVLVFTALSTLLAFGWIRESPARLFRAVLTTARRPAAQQG